MYIISSGAPSHHWIVIACSFYVYNNIIPEVGWLFGIKSGSAIQIKANHMLAATEIAPEMADDNSGSG